LDSSKFDELTKALATATSRRQALRRIGGILGGTALAGLIPGLAFASNSACAKFCNAVFGADTLAASKCISDAAHGKGLCRQCGSVAPSSICCTRDSSGFCSSYIGAHCPCPSGQTCQNGKCAPCIVNWGTCSGNTDCCSGNCSNGFCCGSGQVGLCNGSCATPCTANTDCSAGCVCAPDLSGATYCSPLNFEGNRCGTDCGCPHGQFCGIGEFGGTCIALC
jgi:hypothetical protein